jgi:hypothetical protein
MSRAMDAHQVARCCIQDLCTRSGEGQYAILGEAGRVSHAFDSVLDCWPGQVMTFPGLIDEITVRQWGFKLTQAVRQAGLTVGPVQSNPPATRGGDVR